MDTLIKAVKARGHTIDVRNDCTYVLVEGHDFKIALREKMRKEIIQDKPWNRTVYHPNGVLAFQAGGYIGKEWKDGTVPLEGYLVNIITYLELEAQRWTEQQKRFAIQEDERKKRSGYKSSWRNNGIKN